VAPIPGLGAFGKFFGRTLSEGAGVATGLAVAGALEPEVQGLINDSWSLDPSRPLRPEDAATIAAERPALADWAHGEARQSGVSGPRFRRHRPRPGSRSCSNCGGAGSSVQTT